jgi:hypothetical protein
MNKGVHREALMQDLEQGDRTSERRALDLSVVQVCASALAAVAAAILASELGVYGTIIGAAVVSVGATIGGAMFQHLFRRTGEGIRNRVPSGTPPVTVAEGESVRTYRAGGGRFRLWGWKGRALLAGLVFVLAMGTLTVVELVAGKPVAAVVRNEPGSGTSLGGGTAGGATPAPQDTPSAGQPSGGASTDPGSSAAPGSGGTPSAGGSSTPSAPPSTASASPSATSIPTPSPTAPATGAGNASTAGPGSTAGTPGSVPSP